MDDLTSQIREAGFNLRLLTLHVEPSAEPGACAARLEVVAEVEPVRVREWEAVVARLSEWAFARDWFLASSGV